MSQALKLLFGGLSRSITKNKLPGSVSTSTLLKKISPALIPYMTMAGTELAQRLGPGGQQAVIRPDVMLWWIPIYAVDKVEVARSDKILKFRSIGGQFFAFQEADSMGVRIDFKLYGPLRFIYLHLLYTLYLRGMGTYKAEKIEDISPRNQAGESIISGKIVNGYTNEGLFAPVRYQSAVTVNSSLPIPLETSNWGGDTFYQGNVQTVTIPASENRLPSKYASTTPLEDVPSWKRRERYLVRKTFPIIMEEEIFIDMYIETFLWSKSVNENGLEEITINLLIRRYIEPPKKFFLESREQVGEVKKREYNRTSLQNVNGRLQTSKTADIDTLNRQKVVIRIRGRTAGAQFGPYDEPTDTAAYAEARVNEPGINARISKWRQYYRVEAYTQTQEGSAKLAKAQQEEQVEIAKSKYKTTEDIANVKTITHKYVGTKVENQSSAEFKMLNLNLLWRMFWTGYYMNFGAWRGWRMTTDPMLSRMSVFLGKTQTVNGQQDNNTATTQSSDIEPSIAIPEDILDEKAMAPDILAQFGIGDEDELENIFQVEQGNKQETFEEMLYKGFTAHKIEGIATTRGDLMFSAPFEGAFEFYINTNGYTNLYNIKFSFGNGSIDITEGSVYYLGAADSALQREWEEQPDGSFRINCPVEDEMYLYFHKLEISNNEALITAYIIHPRDGI